MTRSVTFRSAHKLPLGVRAMARLGGRETPDPICDALVESGLEVPAPGGIALITDHYIPQLSGPRPTLLVRTPYGRGFPWDELFGAQFARQGFHVVIQSCRGTGGSDGEFEPMRNEGADGRAAVAWLREQDWFNGVLGTIGPSYLGYVQWALASDPPPELRAMVAQNSMSDVYKFLYRDGALALEDALTGSVAMLSMEYGFGRLFVAMLRLLRHFRQISRKLPLIDAYPAAFGHRVEWFEQWLAHPDQADPYWDGMAAGLGPGTVPVSLVSGWDDVCLDQTLELYGRLREAGREVRLLVGPWSHTSSFDKGWPVVFGDALGWLRTHLADESASHPDHAVRVHVGGCDEWRDLPDWPPPAAGALA
jgi:putative CocE/NonD family hydrolase